MPYPGLKAGAIYLPPLWGFGLGLLHKPLSKRYVKERNVYHVTRGAFYHNLFRLEWKLDAKLFTHLRQGYGGLARKRRESIQPGIKGQD
jgi:hypothetical protein